MTIRAFTSHDMKMAAHTGLVFVIALSAIGMYFLLSYCLKVTYRENDWRILILKNLVDKFYQNSVYFDTKYIILYF